MRGDSPLEWRLGGGSWIPIEALCRDSDYSFFRWRLEGLHPDAEHTVEVSSRGETRTLTFQTPEVPQGRLRARFGIVPDLHLTGSWERSVRIPRGTKRLYPLAERLARKYVQHLEAAAVDGIVFPGDTLDPANDETVTTLRRLMESVATPCHLILGNHEVYGSQNERAFHRALDLPEEGYRSLRHDGVRCILLSTPHQSSLDPGRAQFRWLQRELASCDPNEHVVLFAHFALLLHPCVQGWKNDGMQQLHDHEAVLELLSGHPQVRAFVAGHKNVPSLVEQDGIAHLLCPQFIQAPCGHSILEVYDDALAFNVYEIEEMDILQISREAFELDYAERFGRPEHRNFTRFHRS